MPWVGLAAGAGAVALGRDVWLRSDGAGFADVLYYACVATAGLPALQAQWALYERDDRLALLPLPLPPDAHFSDAVRITAARSCPLALALLGLALGALVAGAPSSAALAAVGQVAGSIAATVLAGIGLAALAGRAAMRTEHAAWQRVRETLAGGWAAAEHAPFFWAPGLAVALAAFTTAGVRQGPIAAAVAIAGSAVLFAFARPAFRQALFQVAPLAYEHARSLFGGERPPPLSPLGLSVGRLLPQAARPFFVKDAIQMARVGRGRGVLAGLGVAAIAIASLRTDAAPWVTSAAAGLVGLLAASAVRIARADASPRWLDRALPARPGAVVVGRAVAAALLPAAIGICAALGLLAGGASGARAVFVAIVAMPFGLAAATCARLHGVTASWSYGAIAVGTAAAGGLLP